MNLLINGWFWGRTRTGSGRYLRAVLETGVLQGRGRVWVAVPAPSPAGRRPAGPPEGGALGVDLLSLPLPPLPENLAKVWWEQVTLPRLAVRLGVDRLWVPYWGSPLRPPVPTAVTVHDVIPLALSAYRGDLRIRAYTALVARAARRAQAVLTDSHHAAGEIARHLGIPPARIHVHPLGVDPALTPPDPEALAAFRRRHRLPNRYLAYLGGFDVRKNVPLLFEVLRRGPDLPPLVLAGARPSPGGIFPDLDRLAADLGDRVRFPGPLPEEELASFLGGSVAFLYPSRYEGFGLPPLEAMACGVPVLVADAASLPEVVGPDGILLPPDDPAPWVRALRRLLAAPDLARRLGERGRERARAFSWVRTAREVAAVLARIGGG